jgi:hypothetical protein
MKSQIPELTEEDMPLVKILLFIYTFKSSFLFNFPFTDVFST